MRKIIVLSSFALALFLLLLFNQSKIGLEKVDQTNSTLENEETKTKTEEVMSDYQYGISTSDRLAADVAKEVLDEGGTAIDAAVAISYALGISEPYGSGIGGGGGMMIKLKDEEPVFLDYREVSDKTGEQRDDMIAIPSFVYAMDYINDQYGSLPMERLIQPAIDMAEEGIPVSEELAYQLNYYKDWISHVYPEGYDMNNNPLKVGDTFKLPKVAKILRQIVDDGPDSFYEMLQEEMRDPLQFEIDELKEIVVQEKKPLETVVDGYTFYAPPKPFSGETALQILKGIELSDIPSVWEGNVQDLVQLFKITRNSYAYRFENNGDPAFVKESDGLTDDVLDYITTNEDFEMIEDDEPVSTTHFSIVDQYGNIVSATNTLGNFFGHKQNQFGFFFNSNLTVASPNSDSPNRLEPYKRSRTFMAPMMFEKDDEIIALGSPGGSRIPELMSQVIHSYMEDNDLQKAVDKLRISVLNDNVAFEDYIAPEISTSLEEEGYGVSVNTSPLFFGGINAIGKKDQQIFGVADSRRHGTLLISE